MTVSDAPGQETTVGATPGPTDPILQVRDLQKHFPITEGMFQREIDRVRAVDGISFDVRRGETFGLVGESGCGKSTVALNVVRLQRPTAGSVLFDGEDITEHDGAELKRFRRRAQMIFQDPDTSFDPRMTIGDSIEEPLIVHGLRDRNRRRNIVKNLLERVGLQRSDVDRYPHEFSGGQKQRIALARALVLNPELIVADEPVAALDVSIQAEILALLSDIQEQFGLSLLIISHNLRVIRQICDRVAVMYLGKIVERGPTESVFGDPAHPYTRALLETMPTPDPRRRDVKVKLSGDVPSPSNPPSGCRFHTRCPEVIPPEDLDLDQSVWRGIMNLKQRVHAGAVDVEEVRLRLAAESADEIDPDAIAEGNIRAEIRSAHDIPDRIPDPTAEDVVGRVIDHLVEADQRAASDLLSETIDTVCRTDEPDQYDISAEHTSCCHRNAPDWPS